MGLEAGLRQGLQWCPTRKRLRRKPKSALEEDSRSEDEMGKGSVPEAKGGDGVSTAAFHREVGKDRPRRGRAWLEEGPH